MKTKFATKSVAVFAALLVSALCALALPLRAAVIDAGAFRVDPSTLSPDYEPVSATQVAVCSGIVLTYRGLTNE